MQSTKIDAAFADYHIIFGMSSLCTDKEYSLVNIKRDDLKDLVSKLQYIEQLTWKQFSNLPDRGKGLTVESPNSKSWIMINQLDRSPKKEIEKYYFHFRGKDLVRIFGYQDKNIFYITHYDLKGEIHKH